MVRRIRYWGRLCPFVFPALLVCTAGVALALWLPRALAPIAVCERIFSSVAALVVLASAPRESVPYRLLLLLFPWVGAAVCLLLPKRRPRQAVPAGGETLEEAVASLASPCGAGVVSLAECEYFPTGREMAERLLRDLEGAEREILLDYYILDRGKFLDGVLSVLLRKARDGVAIRLIYDDLGSAKLSRKTFAALVAAGAEVTAYRPLKTRALFTLNRRDHRKLAVIDGAVAYTGGINLADEYIGELIRFGHWKDSAVRIAGPAAARFAALFKKGSAGAKTADNAQQVANCGTRCVPFADEDDVRVGEDIYLKTIYAAKSSLMLCTPYLIPPERIFSALSAAARAGVEVRVMIPRIPDKRTVFALTRATARELTAEGVSVREYTAGFLHAKSAVADGQYALIGSYNLDRRSFSAQAECGVLLSGGEVVGDMRRDFEEMWEAGTPVGKAGVRERLLAFLLRPFSPLL